MYSNKPLPWVLPGSQPSSAWRSVYRQRTAGLGAGLAAGFSALGAGAGLGLGAGLAAAGAGAGAGVVTVMIFTLPAAAKKHAFASLTTLPQSWQGRRTADRHTQRAGPFLCRRASTHKPEGHPCFNHGSGAHKPAPICHLARKQALAHERTAGQRPVDWLCAGDCYSHCSASSSSSRSPAGASKRPDFSELLRIPQLLLQHQ
jgi:hypothetical protein